MSFIPPLAIGSVISNKQLSAMFKVGNMGGMRRSKATGSLVLICDNTKGLYQDQWHEGRLLYTGMGKIGDQVLEGNQNKTLAESNSNGVKVYLFEVSIPGEYTFSGRVRLAAEPYQEMQPDENGKMRKVWMFPLEKVPEGTVAAEVKAVQPAVQEIKRESGQEKSAASAFREDAVLTISLEESAEIELPPSKELDIQALSELFDVMNQSYKLFWFRGILEGVRKWKSAQKFGDIVDQMIVEAWYPVVGHHLSLGPADAVERLILALEEESGLPAETDRNAVLAALASSTDPEIKKLKLRLIQNVPYRLLSPFLKSDNWKYWDEYGLTIAKINSNPATIYTVGFERSLDTFIQIRPAWMDYLSNNLDLLFRWTEGKLLAYLKKQTPGFGRKTEKVAVTEKSDVAAAAVSTASDELKSEFVKKEIVPVTVEVYDPVQVRSEDTAFQVERIQVGEIHELSPMEKLLRRVSREFSRRKLVGDIAVSDEEFELLIKHMRNVYLELYKNRSFVHMDAAFCTALVQIGIRYYNRGNYWSHFEKLLNFGFYNTNHRKWINDAFVNTMKRYNRILLSETELVSSILMHGFVADNYTNDFFDFLFAYYRIDLDRDISRLDRESLDILVENIKRNDNTARTYQIVEQTANAVRTNTRGSKTRIRRYLRLIDKAFWGEPLPEKTGNRLTKAFLVWQEQSRDFDIEKKRSTGAGRRGAKHYSSPYLMFDQKSFAFSLRIPAQMVRFEDAEGLYWSVVVNGRESLIEENPCAAVTGYKTDEHVLPVKADDLLSAFQMELRNTEGRLRLFKIPAAPIRFFDDDGYLYTDNVIDEGEAVSFSGLDFVPVSDAIEDYVTLNSLRMTYYSFVTGDIVSLPDGKPISVGNRIQEGILPRYRVGGVTASDDKLPVYSAAPSVLIKAQAKRAAGMAIAVNGKIYKADDYWDRIQSFELMDRSGETGYIIHLADWGCCEDGLYSVTIDIPNDQTIRQWQFMLIEGMDFRFEDAPYVFKPIGTLCTPDGLLFEKTGDIEDSNTDDDGNHWSFRIGTERDDVKLLYNGVELSFEVPALQYCFQGGEWSCERPVGIWHTDFQPVLQVKYPASRITFSLDDSGDDDDDADHSVTFTKIQERNRFECDLNTFKSCFNRDVAKRKIYLSLPGVEKPVSFLDVHTRSIFVSGMLTENYETETIDGTFDIVGKANYFVDLHFKGEKLADKEPIVDGKISIKSKLRSGSYIAQIFEAEEDEFGFGDLIYYEIGVRRLELVNARDLTGKSLKVVSLYKADDPGNVLKLKRTYAIYNLESLDDLQGHLYTGVMDVRNPDGGGRGIFKVYLEIPDITQLNKGYITFDDDGESLEFLYDDERSIFVREPQEGLRRAASYRRYSKSLYPEEYVFEYEFLAANYVGQSLVCNNVKDYKQPAQSYSLQLRFKGYEKPTRPALSMLVPQRPITGAATGTSIEAAGLSVKAYNALRRAKIKDLAELSSKRCSDLLKIRNLGRKNAIEVVERMEQFGLQLPIDDIMLYKWRMKK